MLGVDYEPTEKQRMWHSGYSAGKEGRGAGKSTFAVMEALKTAVENDNTRVELVSLGTGADYLMNIFKQRVSPELYKYSAMRRMIRLVNGSEICFTNARDRDDRGRKVVAIYDD